MTVSRKCKIESSSILPILTEALRVESMRVRGVTLSQDLRMATHIDQVLVACSSSMYALDVLKSHGLTSAALQMLLNPQTLQVSCSLCLTSLVVLYKSR